MIYPDMVNTLVRESICRAHIRIQGPKLVFALRQIQEGLRAMRLFPLGLGPRAYMGLGISVPYISHVQRTNGVCHLSVKCNTYNLCIKIQFFWLSISFDNIQEFIFNDKYFNQLNSSHIRRGVRKNLVN